MSWNLKVVSSFAKIGAGQGAPQGSANFGSDGHPFVRAGSLERLCAGAGEDSLERIPDSVAKQRRMVLYPAGTILFPKSGMSATLGRVYMLTKPCYVVNHLATVRAGAGASAEFLTHFFRYSSPANLINDSAYPSIRLSDISRWEIPLPPLDEQKRIAAVLDKADALRRQRQESLRLTEELIQSVFIDMFGDPVTNKKNFPIRELGDFFSSPKDGAKCGPFGSALKKLDAQETGVPVWGIDNITTDSRFVDNAFVRISEEKFEELRSYETKDKDILISRAGTVGKMCVVSTVEEQGIIGSNLIRLRLTSDLLDPHWFVAFMKYCKGRVPRLRAGPDGAFTHMSTKILKSLEFPYPSPAMQTEFLKACREVESVRGQARRGQDQIGLFFASLQQRAFRGELDLSRLDLELPEEQNPAPSSPSSQPKLFRPVFAGPSRFTAPPEVEERLKEMEEQARSSSVDQVPWSEEYFKYRILDRALQAPRGFSEIWEAVERDIEEPSYETVKETVWDFVTDGTLEQRFDEKRKEVVFSPRS